MCRRTEKQGRAGAGSTTGRVPRRAELPRGWIPSLLFSGQTPVATADGSATGRMSKAHKCVSRESGFQQMGACSHLVLGRTWKVTFILSKTP